MRFVPVILNRLLLVFLLFQGVTTPLVFSESELEKKVAKRVKKLGKKHNLAKWSKKITKVKSKLNGSRNLFYRTPGLGIKNVPYKKLLSHEKDIGKVLKYQEPLEQLVKDLETKSLINEIFPRRDRVKSVEAIREKALFEKKLIKEEPSRKREAEYTLKKLKSLQKNFRNLLADWLYFYSRQAIYFTVKEKFEKNHFADNTKIYREFIRRSELAKKGIQQDPKAAKGTLKNLRTKLNIPLKDMISLEASLKPENLLTGILDRAKDDKIQFTKKGKNKTRPLLESFSRKNLQVVLFRKQKWLDLEEYLNGEIKKADRHIAYLKRKDRKRAELKKRVAALESGKYQSPQDSPENGVSPDESDSGETDRVASAAILDASYSRGMSKRSGALKTSHVGSASKKLHVQVDDFDENLHKTDKFDFNIEQKTSFDRISVSSKEALSLYTYRAKSGRAGKADLKQFINEVAVISYGSMDEFISYKLPKKWKTGRRVKWIKEKSSAKKKNHDRTFTYVELFVEAHRYKKNKPSEEPRVSRKFISPNMIVIFDAGGGINRYQTFSNIDRVKIRNSDLVDGGLHYKFLNYTVQGSRIHLHGIDHEIKLAGL